MLVCSRPTRRLLRRKLMTLLSRSGSWLSESSFATDLDFARRPYEGASRVRPVEDPGRPSEVFVDERRAFDAQSSSVRKAEEGRGSLID